MRVEFTNYGMRKMGQLFLVRHGQASFGSHNYDQLSELGFDQARVLGKWFAHCETRFDVVITGALQRHQQTAQACIEALQQSGEAIAKDAQCTEFLIEPAYNEFNHDEVMQRFRPDFANPERVQSFLRETPNAKHALQAIFEQAMQRWMSGENDEDYSETWQQFRTRCVAALSKTINTLEPSQRAIVFTSGGTIATICQHLLGMSDQQVYRLNWSLVNSAVSKILFRREQVSLSYLNNFSHLEWNGKPDWITYR